MGRGDPEDASYASISFDDYDKFAKAQLNKGDRDSAFQALLLGLWEVNEMMRAVSHSNYFTTSFIAFRHQAKVSELIGRLETLLDLSVPADMILAAELAREQSQFDKAIEILKAINFEGDDLRKFSNVIRECADRKLAIVRPVHIL
jgi:hypothetical protein